MKKTFFVVFVLICCSSFSQIKIRKEKVEEVHKVKIAQIDSLYPMTKLSQSPQYRKYIGLKLFLKPASQKYKVSSSELTPDIRKINKKESEISEKDYLKIVNPKKTRYGFAGPSDLEYIDFVEYAGKYFTILNIFTEKRRSTEGYKSIVKVDFSDETKKDARYRYLKIILKEENTNELFIWSLRADGLNGERDPFLLTTYYGKHEQICNKTPKFVALKNKYDLVDITNGNKISLKKGDTITCKGFELVDLKEFRFLQPRYIFSTKNNAELMVEARKLVFNYKYATFGDYVSLEEYNRKMELKKMAAEERAKRKEEERLKREKEQKELKNSLVKKYGSKYGKLIFESKVVIGMTKEMCTDAWGSPSDVNKMISKHTVLEQWVYPGFNYLYFDKTGKLTTIQNF